MAVNRVMEMPWLLGLLGFAVAASVTPGPNNIMVAAAAARHGIAATLPHMLGICTGFAVMIVLVGLAVTGVTARVAGIAAVLRWVSLAWLLLLAWRIATAPPPGQGRNRPAMGFAGGAMFQWINPKAWLLALSVGALFVAPVQSAWPVPPALLVVAAVFFAVGLPCNLLWAGLGRGATRLLTSPARLRAFNVAMAILLVVSMLPALL
jgi:threonine/homoserine/homoserine lactone efflux protein